MSGRTQFSTIKKSNKKDFYKNDVDKILVKKKNHKQKSYLNIILDLMMMMIKLLTSPNDWIC